MKMVVDKKAQSLVSAVLNFLFNNSSEYDLNNFARDVVGFIHAKNKDDVAVEFIKSTFAAILLRHFDSSANLVTVKKIIGELFYSLGERAEQLTWNSDDRNIVKKIEVTCKLHARRSNCEMQVRALPNIQKLADSDLANERILAAAQEQVAQIRLS